MAQNEKTPEKEFQSSENIYQQIKTAHINHSRPLFDLSGVEEVKINIRASKEVPVGIFHPDPLLPSHYIAHPDTIKAIRKDIFVTDPELLDFEATINCLGCGKVLDQQFWLHCPFCGKDFK